MRIRIKTKKARTVKNRKIQAVEKPERVSGPRYWLAAGALAAYATGSAQTAIAPSFNPSACRLSYTQPYNASEPR